MVGLSEEVVVGMCWWRAGGLNTQPEGGQKRKERHDSDITLQSITLHKCIKFNKC